jgi:hypothetical protein
MADRGKQARFFVGGGCGAIILQIVWPSTIVDNVLGECHAFCRFVNLQKGKAHSNRYKSLHALPNPNFHTFSVASGLEYKLNPVYKGHSRKP